MSDSPIHKITIEFEDRIISMEGEDAKRWLQIVNSQSTMAHIHGMKCPELPWKIEVKP